MNLNEIKGQIASYRSTDPSKLDPQRFAEGMSQLSGLHQEVANYVAEDAKRSYDGIRLHKEIEAIENSWAETQLAPGKKAGKLQEDNSKLMQVIKAVAQTALTFKKKIGEAVKQQNRQVHLADSTKADPSSPPPPPSDPAGPVLPGPDDDPDHGEEWKKGD